MVIDYSVSRMACTTRIFDQEVQTLEGNEKGQVGYKLVCVCVEEEEEGARNWFATI